LLLDTRHSVCGTEKPDASPNTPCSHDTNQDSITTLWSSK
jgi:hypothetical protein